MARESVLATAEWALAHLDVQATVFVETGNSDAAYRKGHVPGAVWIGWEEFQDDVRLGVIDRGAFEKLLSTKGIGNDDTVVFYSVNTNLLAALSLWYFRLYGHRSVKLLDGGREKWQRDGHPLTAEETVRQATSYHAGEPDRSIRATRDDVLAAIGTGNLIDVRTPDEYAGRVFAPGFAGEAFAPGNNPHEVAQRAGHVPGAVNLEWEEVLNEDGTFKSERELERFYAGLDPGAGIHHVLLGGCPLGALVVRPERVARPAGCQELRRVLGRVRLAGGSARRARRRCALTVPATHPIVGGFR